jgi:hypothetical protein
MPNVANQVPESGELGKLQKEHRDGLMPGDLTPRVLRY